MRSEFAPEWVLSVVPAGFMAPTMSVPRPDGTLLYLKLRDDPATVNTVVLPVFPE